ERVQRKLEKLLGGEAERQIEGPASREANARKETQDNEERRHRAAAAKEMQEPVAGINPAERGKNVPPGAVELRSGRFHEARKRQNALRADEPICLHPERHERREATDADEAEKERGRESERREGDRFSPEDTGHGRGAASMARDESVSELGDWGKTRHMPVHAQQPGAARCEGERAK